MRDDDDRLTISERATVQPDADVPEEIEERLKREADDAELELHG